MIKGSNYLEALARTETVVFDKTGNLTKGTFAVTQCFLQGISRDDLLELAAYAEKESNHPISRSIVKAYGKELKGSRTAEAQELAGYGACISLDRRQVLAGNAKLMGQKKISFQPIQEDGTVVYVAENGTFRGAIVIEDEIKEDAAFAIADLKRSGVRRTVMLTGDADVSGRKAAKKLGLNEVYTELLPADKVKYVEHLLSQTSQNGKAGLCGRRNQ